VAIFAFGSALATLAGRCPVIVPVLTLAILDVLRVIPLGR
jgi:hypothetical protein